MSSSPPSPWITRFAPLIAERGRVLDAAELTPFGPLWRRDAPKGLVVLAQDSAGVGFFSALGWAVLALRDPARLSEAMAALDLYLTPDGVWRDKRLEKGGFIDEPAPASSLYHILGAFEQLAASWPRIRDGAEAGLDLR